VTRRTELQAAREHMAPLIRRLVDDLAPQAVIRCAQIYANRTVERCDRLQALLALLCFAARGGAGSIEAKTVLALASSRRAATE
jgi:hypothetical protein